jgi:putative Holliday junction resolvase
MRIMGVDLGERWIGMALSDETATIAGGLPTLKSIGPRKDASAIAALAREHGAGEVIVGLPRLLDGSIGAQGQKVLDFIGRLRQKLSAPVVPWDERLTSVLAQQALIEGDVSRRNRKTAVDKVAAILILQNYLDYRKTTEAEALRTPD